VTGACEAFGWSLDHVVHDVPVAQLLALSSCRAWANGMEPAGENYSDRDLTRTLENLTRTH
jgi:hypothetical protein